MIQENVCILKRHFKITIDKDRSVNKEEVQSNYTQNSDRRAEAEQSG
ncbi:hypothetical protein D920_00128 [Enterococcus faecalis 13-SD-W-01]|nr:hypothetical protein D920_00128 [Enterococcus faecalis 13-SD-W-01]